MNHISIIVPIYNSEHYLEKCISSLVSQTYKNIEVILVNDGSPDNSHLICDNFASLNPNIKIINKKNGGAADALNVGTDAAKGDYIMYVDADDWLEDNACELALKYITESNSDIAIWGNIYEYPDKTIYNKLVFDSLKTFEGNELFNLRKRMIGLTGSDLRNPTKTDALSPGWGKLFKRTLFEKNCKYWVDTKIIGSSDVFFNIQIFSKAQKVIYINKQLYHYRKVNIFSLTKTYGSTLHIKLNNLFNHINNFIKDNNIVGFEDALNNRIALSHINITLSLSSKYNNDNFANKKKILKSIFNNSMFNNAIKKLNIKNMPLHWQIFFFAIKNKSVLGVYILGKIMIRLK